MVRDARRCRAPHHEGLRPHPEEPRSGVSKDAPSHRCDFAFSRHELPEVLHLVCPHKYRGRREDRVRAAPAVSQAVAKEICCPRAYRFSGEPPAFPAQWLYGLYEIVLVTLLFVTPSPCEALASSRVDACIGASDPNDFTVRNSSVRLRYRASTASHRTFVTIASRPSHRVRQAELCR
jgi:hypothetical protein